MDANKLYILRDFIGTNKVLFKIPVYQRNYDWSETNCNRLLNDIKKIIKTGEKHFLGTIVFMAEKDGGFALREYIIIDGQQRLTTIMILLKALADVCASIGSDCESTIYEEYLHNRKCSEEFKVKLKPIKSDNEQFMLLLKSRFDEIDKETHIYKNYNVSKLFFEKLIADGMDPDGILEALDKLEIVEIVLTKGEDDPQVIFESINSTGLDLTNSDLIRNFLLMNAENQDYLYENYWLDIEKALKSGSNYSNLDLFFVQYLVCKTSTPANSKYLYEKFVKLYDDFEYTQQTLLEELKYFADIFKTFVYGNEKYSKEVNIQLKKIRDLNQSTCYPFLMHIFDDYNQGVIDEDTLIKILELLVSYLLRRIVCGVPSNSLRGLFVYLYNRVFKVTANKNCYYDSINKFIYSITSKDVMPTNSEFEKYLSTSNVYSNTALCKFLLMDIENGDSKEILKSDNLTIEHIMPQSLSSSWSHISKERHEEYVHTLGNLSVTGYNSELSNKSFDEKKQIIHENSKAVILNSDVLNQDIWDIETIKSRTKRLTGILLKRYNVEEIINKNIEFEYSTIITLDNYDEVTGKKLLYFTFENDTYKQNKYILMLLDIIRLLYKKNPEKIIKLAESNYSFNARSTHAHISSTGENQRWTSKLFENIYIECNLSSWSCMKFIDALLDEFGIDKSVFKIHVRIEENDNEVDEEIEII
ncbi:MAG: DUF262 domain-containing HNH endonuclease family protein [Clostridia bacterium]